MRKRSQRLWLIGAAGLLVSGAVALAATGLRDTMAYFYAPSELAEKPVSTSQSVRVGGLVEKGSIQRGENATVRFKITDGGHALPVSYTGLLPDLFEEGQGVVAEGRVNEQGELVAKRVLARHDETYMPKEVYEALRKREEQTGAGAAYGGTAAPAPEPRT